MTALDAVNLEIRKIQYAMQQCVSPEGYVHNHHKYRYKMLVSLLAEFKRSKDWLEEQRIGVQTKEMIHDKR